MTELKPTNLLAVEVPMEAIGIYMNYNLLIYTIGGTPEAFKISEKEESFTILGTVTADEISFDVEKYVDGYEWEDSPDNGIRKAYRGYETPFDRDAENYWDNYYMDTKDDSFRSLLSSSGLPLEAKKYLIIERKK